MSINMRDSSRRQFGIHDGCVTPTTLLGAATIVSTSLSSVLRRVNGIQENYSGATIEEDSSENKDRVGAGRSFKERIEAILEGKKNVDGAYSCGFDCNEFDKKKKEDEPVDFATYVTKASAAMTPRRTRTSDFNSRPVSATPPRRTKATAEFQTPPPMARIRGQSTDHSGESSKGSSSLKSILKTPESKKTEKQHEWKSKMKILQEQKMSKQRSRSAGDRFVKSRPKQRRGGKGVQRQQGLANIVGAHFLNIIDHQCGAADDIYQDSEDESTLEADSSDSNSSGLFPSKNQQAFDKKRKKVYDEKMQKALLRSPTSMQSAKSEAAVLVDARLEFSMPDIPAVRQGFSDDAGQISDVSNVSSAASEKIDAKESGFIKAFVQDMINVGFLFFWQKEIMNMSPVSVELRLKPGYQTPSGEYCGPRLVWQENEFDAYGINLFDIQMLDNATPEQLKEYPFAIPSRTIYLRMQRGQEFVFEAPSEEKAFRFVHGMKWLVARLSFNLVVGNIDVIFEILQVKAPKIIGGLPDSRSIKELRRVIAMDDLAQQLLERSVPYGAFSEEKAEFSV